jgi:polyphenol oxidase
MSQAKPGNDDRLAPSSRAHFEQGQEALHNQPLVLESLLGVVAGGSPTVVRVPGWERLHWLRHGFSTRAGGVSTVYRSSVTQTGTDSQAGSAGDLNLGWTADDRAELVAENRRRFTDAVWNDNSDDADAGEPTLITVRQVHAAVSRVVGADSCAALVSESGRALCEGDGLITVAPGLLLGIQTADCVPVLVVDAERRAVAAFHAGWRGTVGRIVEQGVARMQREFGSRAEDLMAAIGPSIGACCYMVGEEVRRAFHENFEYAETLFRLESGTASGLFTLDLWEANRRQLLAAGIAEEAITVVGECTACAGLPDARRYFSHRAERGFTGRMLSAIGITVQR